MKCHAELVSASKTNTVWDPETTHETSSGHGSGWQNVKTINAFVLETRCKVKFTKLIDLLYNLDAYSYPVVS